MIPKTGGKNLIQIAIIILLLLAAIFTVVLLERANHRPSEHLVTFQVNASGGYALIELKTPQDSIQPAQILTVPWKMEMTLPTGAEVYLTAANPTQTGELNCSILLDNQTWKSEKKEAPQDGVACAGIVH